VPQALVFIVFVPDGRCRRIAVEVGRVEYVLPRSPG